MTVYKALLPRDDEDRLYVKKWRRKRPASIVDSVDVSVQRLEDDIKNAEKDWLHLPETTETN